MFLQDEQTIFSSSTLISHTGYILNIDGARNREKIFEHWKRGMNSILNLNTTWTTANILNYIDIVSLAL